MRGIIGTLVMGLCLLTGVAHAQVAVPSFNPAARGGTATNPAVQQWGAPSRVVAGVTQGTSVTTPGAAGAKDLEFDVNGSFLSARGVGESWAVGAEGSSQAFESTAPDGFDVSGSSGTTEIALSGLIGDYLAIGIGQQSSSFVVDDDFTDEATLPLIGVSLRFAETIFLGAAGGNETLKRDPDLVGGIEFEETRQVVRYGAGFRTGDETSGFRVEYNVETRQPITVDIAPTTEADIAESVSNTASLEVKLANILLGGTVRNTEADEDGDVVDRSTTDISIGWVPMQGLTLVATVSSEKATNDTNDDEEETTVTAVAVGWMF